MVVEFSSILGHPEYVKICDKSGAPLLIKELTDNERQEGKCSLVMPTVKSTDVFCKVLFSTPYGMVSNLPVLVN